MAIPQSTLDDLNQRLAATRWPTPISGTTWERGAPVSYLKELAEYWRTTFDWRAAEERLNAIPQFVTDVDGVDIHFLHVRSPEPNAVPLLLTHGWPSCNVEFADVIGPLTDPASHGGDPADAFHVVIPSIPGYGFSAAPAEAGWDVFRVARAWATLMAKLGYPRYFAQGGDWGSPISIQLGLADPEHLAGVHLSMLVTIPPPNAPELMASLTEIEGARLGFGMAFEQDGTGWRKIQSTRPLTLSYGLADSPVGQLAWIVEKYKEWADAADVPEDALSRDDMLTLATISWANSSALSSAQLYYESSQTMEAFLRTWAGPWPLAMPVGVAFFAGDVVQPVRPIAEQLLPISYWAEYDRGGHFPALEQPKVFVEDIRTFFRTLR
jgi:microsomal epoxide hydrolase